MAFIIDVIGKVLVREIPPESSFEHFILYDDLPQGTKIVPEDYQLTFNDVQRKDIFLYVDQDWVVQKSAYGYSIFE